MTCLQKHIWNSYDKEELQKLSLVLPSTEWEKKVRKNWDEVAKPIDGMGKFEDMIARIGAVGHTDRIDLHPRAVLIFCADNGIVEEGISQSGQEVTARVAKAMGQKNSSVGRMAEYIHADTIPVDIGMNSTEKFEHVLDKKIRCGTRNFLKEPAMTEQETMQAIAAGIDLVYDCRNRGYRILASGEMGIGNTTTSSAVAAALLQCSADRVTGKGAGLSDAGLEHKKQVIEAAIRKYDLYHADPFTILQTVGGLDLAALTGMCMGGALYQIPIVLDGVISLVAALLAERILPGTKAYLFPSHQGKEPAVKPLLAALQMDPVIHGDLALGEGTGAVMLLALLDLALEVYHTGGRFSQIQVEQYERFDTIC